MSDLLNVEGFSQYKKDTSAGGVVNVDKRSYDNYIATRNILRQRKIEQEATKETVETLAVEINSIKEDMKDIKNILMALINK
jgi:ABC-type transporter lipoprotein component MlaA